MMRLRVSLTSVILLTTIIALAVPLWRLGREVGPMKEELARLRDEAGYLNIENPDHVHACRIWLPEQASESSWIWRWRIYIPEKGTFYLHDRPYAVPATGVPPRSKFRGGSQLASGEHVLDLRISRDTEAEHLVARLQGYSNKNVRGSEFIIRERLQENWTDPHTSTGYPQAVCEQIGARTTVRSPPNEPLVLLRLRASPLVAASQSDDGSVTRWEHVRFEEPCDGFILWIANYEK